MSELEKRFSPSYWTKRYTQEKAVDNYLAVTTKLSKEIIKTVPCERDIPYGNGKREKYDVYGTDLPDDAPILILFHGGYWQYKELSKDNFNTPARALYKLGIKTIVIGYTLCPDCTVYEINQKATCAVQMCLDYAKKLGSKSVGVAGHSAGAQIAINSIYNLFNSPSTSQSSNLFKAAFLLGGIFDLTEIVDTSYNEALKLKMSDAKQLSPMFQNYDNFRNKSLKVFICIGSNDCPGFIDQSKRFYEMLMEQNLTKEQVELRTFDSLDHYDITERLDDVNFEVVQVIAKTLLKN